ncbi:LANO_0E09252g1_1 [Lachancea nothofagi CBS 11611]|uniref:LANO_0E09252g1_1 n=1 Tax=Lachancea nothofagi CBS 11611 TaxID=1266666 RepID=A0A1G4JVL8_9SACH|nr:LANO_0E09252g1_1 [Lachancea nothofagi CBS 11611]
MSRERIVSDATRLLTPSSGLSLDDVVQKYATKTNLSRQILQDPQDFSNEFWTQFQQYLVVDGSRLRVCHNLPIQHGDGPVYVFIHGLGGNMTQFEPLLRLLNELNEGFLAIDLPGFGYSEEWPKYDMLEITKVVERVVHKLTERKKLVVVGHSMGCHVAMHFILNFDTEYSIRDMVFLSPPAPNLPQLNTLTARLGLFVLGNLPVLFDWYRIYFDQSKGLQSSGIMQFFHNDEPYRKLWQFFYNVQIKSRSIVQYLRGWAPIDWSSKSFERLNSTVIITGDVDPVTPLATTKSFYAALESVRNRNLIILEGCSHNICFDSPKEVAQQFLTAVVDRHG